MVKFRVYYDPNGLEELCKLSPFNLKKDLKGIDATEIDRIAEVIGNELFYGINHPPASTALFWNQPRNVALAKIRTLDIGRKSGKSGGYRCIVLVDMVHHYAFLLHLYRHSHGEKENISNGAMNQLKKLVQEYSEAICAAQ